MKSLKVLCCTLKVDFMPGFSDQIFQLVIYDIERKERWVGDILRIKFEARLIAPKETITLLDQMPIFWCLSYFLFNYLALFLKV